MVDLATVRENIFRSVLPNLASHPSRVRGWRLYGIGGETPSWIEVPAEGDGFAVLGSRWGCDLVLLDDPSIADRHLAAVMVHARKDSPHADRIRLIDLHTGVPMFLDDDVPRWAVVDAAMSVRVGHHVLCAYPVGADAADEREVSGLRASPCAPAGRTPGRVRLTVDRLGVGASVELPMEDLDDGVVIGRRLNRLDDGIRRVLDHAAISRAHLLLLRDVGEILALDLRSTNGTHVGGRRIGRHRITAADTLELGRIVTLRVTCVEG